MRARTDAVADDAGHRNGGIEARETRGHRGDRTRDARGVNDENNRRPEPLRNLGARALVAVWRRRIEQTHHPFDHRDVGARGRARKSRDHRIAIHHPAVEVMRANAGGAFVIGGIEIVRAALERRDLEPARAHRTDQCDSRSSLARAAGGRGDDDARNFGGGNHREWRYYYNKNGDTDATARASVRMPVARVCFVFLSPELKMFHVKHRVWILGLLCHKVLEAETAPCHTRLHGTAEGGRGGTV